MSITQQLISFGLSAREALIYQHLMKHAELPAFDIAKETKIPRTTVYELLETLIEKNLVSISRRNNVAYYTAESPNRLLSIIKEKEEAAKLVIPELFSLSRARDINPSVKLFTGAEGLKAVLDDITDTLELTHEKLLYAIASPELIKQSPKYFPAWIGRREKLGVFTRLITPDDGTHSVAPLYRSNELRETRLLPEKFVVNSSIDIYPNKIAMFSEKEGDDFHAIIIESASLYETFKTFFEFMWAHCERGDK